MNSPGSGPPKLDGHDDEHWLQRWWRPAMAWQYFVVCLCDFIVFPIGNNIFSAISNTPLKDYHPLTLQGGGLYHMAMGAIIGVTAWTRTQEKMASFGGSPFNMGAVMTAQSDQVTTVPRPSQPKSSRAD